MSVISELRQFASEKLFPRKCPLCGAILRPNERVCGKCSDELVIIQPPICSRCGRPIFDCACRNDEYAFKRCISPFVYTQSVRNGIHRFKFSNKPESADFFGLFMSSVIRREYQGIHFDVVVSVPLHSDDLHRRGYNQAELLAQSAAKRLGLPVGSHVIVKRVHNSPQHTLSRAERARNVEGVYSVARPQIVEGRTILLCDDVITTGSTLNACAQELLNAGARAVYCVTAAAVVGSRERTVKRAYV